METTSCRVPSGGPSSQPSPPSQPVSFVGWMYENPYLTVLIVWIIAAGISAILSGQPMEPFFSIKYRGDDVKTSANSQKPLLVKKSTQRIV